MTIKTKEEARQEAIEWQWKISNCDISFEELFIAQNYFIELGENSIKDKRRRIKQLSLEGKFIKEWESMTQASKEMRISIGDIWRVANNQQKSAKGFIWKYL